MLGGDAGAGCSTGSFRNRTASQSRSLLGRPDWARVRLRSKFDDRDQILEGRRVVLLLLIGGAFTSSSFWVVLLSVAFFGVVLPSPYNSSLLSPFG